MLEAEGLEVLRPLFLSPVLQTLAVPVCMCVHVYACTHGEGQVGAPVSRSELTVRRGPIQYSERAQRRRTLTRPGGVREGFSEEAALSQKHEGVVPRCRKE